MVLMFKEVYFYDDTNYLLLVVYKLHERILCKDELNSTNWS